MRNRATFVVAVAFAALAALAAPAAAQSYPPPANSLSVDDPTPAPGQDVTATLRVCRPGSRATFGFDLRYAGSGSADAQGAASAVLQVPVTAREGRHLITGACLRADGRPLVLWTWITVTDRSDDVGDAVVGSASGPTGAAGGTSGTGAPAATGTTDAAGSYAELAREHQIALELAEVPVRVGPDGDVTPSESAGGTTGSEGDAGHRTGHVEGGRGDLGLLGTVGRVLLGLAAVGSVPAALALSRHSSPRVAEGIA